MEWQIWAYWAIPFEIHTPPYVENYYRFSNGQVQLSNGMASWAIPFETHTPPVTVLIKVVFDRGVGTFKCNSVLGYTT